ncbi:MAG: nucleotide disphospho-sugar-binding domain-containing protein [Acidobacteriota bacterium]
MSKFLFTMLPANDLGLPTRLLPIARLLEDRGHQVALFNPAPAPAKLIADAGFVNLPMPSRPMPAIQGDMAGASAAWDVEEMFGHFFSDEETLRSATSAHVEVVESYGPDVVVDSFGLFTCMAARVLGIPVASVLQGNFHPASDGFRWWNGARPEGLPSAAAAVNAVLAEYGVATVERAVDLLAGELSLIVGTPETDPVSPAANAAHVGSIIWQTGDARLPGWVDELSPDKPVVWVYAGNPRYFGGSMSNPFDSIVVIRAAIASLGNAPMHVVLTSGYQDLPEEVGPLPSNFLHAAYLPGRAMASRCNLMVHHGGHSSVMTGLSAGTPAVIIPTSTERESNARRVTTLGAGEMVKPTEAIHGEKQIELADFSAKVNRCLTENSYRTAARRVCESMSRYGGAEQAADRIEQLAAAKG